MTADVLAGLQKWYSRQCNGDWEHQHGIKIDTLDNPGWQLSVDLEETSLEHCTFTRFVQDRTEADWIVSYVAENRFEARGGPHNLTEMIAIFLDWAEANGKL